MGGRRDGLGGFLHPYIFVLLSRRPLASPKKKRGRTPTPCPLGVATEGPPRRSSRLPWQPEASSPSQPAASRLLPGWSRVRRVSALSPRPLPEKRSPAPSPRPPPSPPWDSSWGGGTRRGRCQQPTPSWGRPAEPLGREARLPGQSAPRWGPRAPPPLPAGEGCPAAGTPGVGS